MRTMMPDELEEYARRLGIEIDRLTTRVANLQRLRPAPAAELRRLAALRNRLLALREEAQFRLGPHPDSRR